MYQKRVDLTGPVLDPSFVNDLAPAGETLRNCMQCGSTHDLSLSGALAPGPGIGMELPKDEVIVIVAVEVEDVLVFGETCTKAVADAISRAGELVLAELEALVP